MFLCTVLETKIKRGHSNGKLRFGLFMYAMVITVGYFTYHEYFGLFLISYVGIVGYLVYVTALAYGSTPDQDTRLMCKLSCSLYVGAFLFLWIPEQLFCDKIRWMNTHAWFHLLSAIAPYCWVVFACLHRARFIGQDLKKYGRFGGLIPFSV